MKKIKNLDNYFKIYQDITKGRIIRKRARSKLLNILRNRAIKEDSEAQYLLGIIYSDESCSDIGLPTKKNRAFYWYTKSCKNNNPYACHNLAYFYEEGIVIPKDEPTEIKLYKKAFTSGLSESGYALYVLHKQRGRPKESIKWLKKVINVDSENGEALIEYAKLSFEGELIKRNYKSVYELIVQAIATKNITQFTYEEAIYLIGIMYFNGLYLKQDYKLGKYLIKLANKDNDHPQISEFENNNKKLFNSIKLNEIIRIPPHLIL